MTQVKIEKRILETQLFTTTKGGLRIKNPATLVVSPSEIEFRKAPFHLKNEIKAMTGAKWLGFRRENPRKVWTVDNCPRNWFQLKFLMGQNPYEWFDRDLIHYEYDHPLMDHQKYMGDTGLTYHYQIWGAEMGVGKTLSALSLMEMSGIDTWFWVGPLKSLENIEREWEKWNFSLSWCIPKNGKALTEALQAGEHNVFLTTYERLLSHMQTRPDNCVVPGGVIFDESSRLKSPTAQRSQAAQDLADNIRAKYDMDGFVILMSGTPSPKSPLDWWKQCLTGDTWVLTDSGPKQIGNISDKPISVRVKDQFVETSGFHCTGLKHVFQLRTEEGYSITGTEDHRFKLLDGEWCELKDLEPGDRIELSNSKPIEWSGEGSFGDGYLLGFTLGDGGWYYGDGNLYARILVYGEKQHLCRFIKNQLPGHYQPTGNDPKLFHHYYLNGLSRRFKFSPNKVIPEEFESRISSECMRGFLCSLFDTDGGIDYNRLRVTFSQSDEGRVLVVQRMLSYFGIHSKLQIKSVKDSIIEGRVVSGQPYHYILHITGDSAEIFSQVIGFKHERKCSVLKERLKHRHKHKSQAFATVGEILSVGQTEVYDIEVPSLNCFSANGLLAHNCEITWPGFLKEGSKDQLESRLGFMVRQELPDNIINVRIGWKDNENKCAVCSHTREDGNHAWDMDHPDRSHHVFEKSFNEVLHMYDRLQGLVTIIHKKDVLSLPEKVYEVDRCEPSPSTVRVAKTVAKGAPNVMTGITWLRELSDGFMYKDVPDGVKQCPTCAGSEQLGKVLTWFDPDQPDEPIRAIDLLEEEYTKTLREEFVDCPRCNGSRQVNKMRRVAREVPCPKEGKLKTRLAQCEETGRIVIFAGFQGSIDRIKGICRKEGWDVVQVDGRGWQVIDKTGKVIKTNKPLHYWADMEHHPQVAFVAHPASGGLSLNLTEARMIVYWSNDFNPESRSQSEDRIHRKGMDENRGCTIVDIYHLPTDEKTHSVLKQNRKLELLTLGEISECLD